jgi:hypothetical protein
MLKMSDRTYVGFWERYGENYRSARGITIPKNEVVKIESGTRPSYVVTANDRRLAIEPELAVEMIRDMEDGLKDEYDYKGVEW